MRVTIHRAHMRNIHGDMCNAGGARNATIVRFVITNTHAGYEYTPPTASTVANTNATIHNKPNTKTKTHTKIKSTTKTKTN